jgi:hypothetical protein
MFTAAQVREWADKAGVDRPKRGPVARSLVVAFLVSNPKTARQTAAEAGVEVGARGPVSQATAEAIASAV